MSDARAAQKRWMPNRMFDPVSNPFAIQNLLEREMPPFVAVRDERPASAFGVDPLAGGTIVKAFEVDRGLQMPDEDFRDDEAQDSDFVAEAPMMGQPRFEAGTAAAHADAFVEAMVDGAPAAEGFMTEAMAADAQAAEAEQPSVAGDAVESEALADAALAASPDPLAADAARSGEASEPPFEMPAAAMPEPVAGEPAAPAPETVAAEAAAAEAEPAPDSEAVRQMIEEARAQAYAEGLEAGRREGEAERPQARQQGYDEGFAAGAEQARAESISEREQQQASAQHEQLQRLQRVIDALQQLSYNADALFEPMRKFAVHLAEQLVRGELQQSPQAISRLVDNALRELNASGDKAVVVHLHPEDLEAYKPTIASFADSLVLRPDAQLERGSVRASLDGSVVEDLMQRRVDGLKKSLSQASASGWRNAGGRLADRVQQGQPVEDVTVTAGADPVVEAAAPADGHA